ncbi:origin recognition complex subunit 6 like [Lecanosticta acicola]|uniref:Origin recognition complex subunit 6 like n=1 Tax=Lecanosticta acicola TaxID=111012 RepID=A0AAI8YW53_9PEZI|nr:origin recognition complex subunit 6 like [Lecanosticta acicola]
MPAPVELSLASLLPTVAFLPPDLISLANSLLSQSRSKAASLSRDEEIARTYACCHIACKRLENRLELEIGKPSPPVAPRVYNKLYGYLDGVLGRVNAGGKGGGTPTRTPRKDVRSTSGNNTPGKENRTSVRTPTTNAIPSNAGTKRSHEETTDQHDIPGFAMPLARAVCKAIRAPAAAPHVLVGATAAVKELRGRVARREDGSNRKRRKTPQSAKSTRPTRSEEAEETVIAEGKWPALLVALCLLTAEKMKDQEDADMRKEAISAAKDACREKTVDTDLRSIGKDVDFYRLEAEDSGWLDMEWFSNVPEDIISAENDVDDAMDVDEDEVEEDVSTPMKKKKQPHKTPLRRKEKHGGKTADDLDVVGPAGLLPGLGTMFQPAIDWLSEERRRDFAQWEKGIMKEIIAVEQKAC